MVRIYTDASTEGNTGVAVSIIKERKKLIKVLMKSYPIIGPSAAELYGILQSVAYLAKIKCKEEVELFTDLETAVRVFTKLSEMDKPNYKEVAYPQVWRQIMRHCKKLNIEFKHINSHQSEFNENVACDRMSVYVRKHLDTLKNMGVIE